eukprot:gene4875-6637_t
MAASARCPQATARLRSHQPSGHQFLLEVGVEQRRRHQPRRAKHSLGHEHHAQKLPHAHLGAAAHHLGVDHVFGLVDQDQEAQAGRGVISANLMGRIVQLAANQYASIGDPKKALELYVRLLRDTANAPGAKGFAHTANRSIASLLIQMGDISQAEGYMRRSTPAIQEARTSGHPAMRAAYAKLGQNWEAEIELGQSFIYEARGQFREAEAALRNAEARKRAGMKGVLSSENPPTESTLLQAVGRFDADHLHLSGARYDPKQHYEAVKDQWIGIRTPDGRSAVVTVPSLTPAGAIYSTMRRGVSPAAVVVNVSLTRSIPN